jgi:subtilase family serine protease
MPEGSFHVGAILTVWMPELLRDNNTAVGPRVIVGARPELVVSSVQGSAIVQGDQVLTSAVNVCNQGFDFSNPTNVEVWLAGQESESLLVGHATVAELEPGHCQTLSVESTTPLPSGTYTLEAVVDPHNQVWELLEDNNRKTGNTVTVTNQ